VDEELLLAVTIDRVDELAYGLGRRVAWRDLDGCGVVQDRAGQRAHLVVKGRREEQVLAARREHREDLADVGQEAHVEHPIGLVEHEDRNLAEIHGALLDVVQQAAGRRDEDLDTRQQHLGLRFDRHAAVHDAGAQRHRAAVRADRLIHLDRELSGRDEDQRANRVAGRREARGGVLAEAVEDRQRKRRGLAGAGLGGGEDVPTLEDERDGGRLDGRGFDVALLGDGSEEVGRQAERFEGQADS